MILFYAGAHRSNIDSSISLLDQAIDNNDVPVFKRLLKKSTKNYPLDNALLSLVIDEFKENISQGIEWMPVNAKICATKDHFHINLTITIPNFTNPINVVQLIFNKEEGKTALLMLDKIIDREFSVAELFNMCISVKK